MDLKAKPASGAVRRSVHGPQQADPRYSTLLCPLLSPSCALTLSSAFVSGEKNAQVSWAHSAVAAPSASRLPPSSERRVPWDGHPGEATSRAGPGVRTWPGVTPGSPSPFIWIPVLDFPGQAGSSQASTGRAVGRVCTCDRVCDSRTSVQGRGICRVWGQFWLHSGKGGAPGSLERGGPHLRFQRETDSHSPSLFLLPSWPGSFTPLINPTGHHQASQVVQR